MHVSLLILLKLALRVALVLLLGHSKCKMTGPTSSVGFNDKCKQNCQWNTSAACQYFVFLVLKSGHMGDPNRQASVCEGSLNSPLIYRYTCEDFKCFSSNCWCTTAMFWSCWCISLRSAIPACSARALWLRSRCSNFVLTVSAWASCSAASSVKLFPDRLIFARVLFFWSMSAMALAPQSPRLLSERSTSGVHTQVHRKIRHLVGAGTGKRKNT